MLLYELDDGWPVVVECVTDSSGVFYCGRIKSIIQCCCGCCKASHSCHVRAPHDACNVQIVFCPIFLHFSKRRQQFNSVITSLSLFSSFLDSTNYKHAAPYLGRAVATSTRLRCLFDSLAVNFFQTCVDTELEPVLSSTHCLTNQPKTYDRLC